MMLCIMARSVENLFKMIAPLRASPAPIGGGGACDGGGSPAKHTIFVYT